MKRKHISLLMDARCGVALCVLVVVGLLCTGLLAAQSATTGQITGIVRDPSGARVPAAKVLLIGEAAVGRETETDGAGAYLFTLVPPGTYRVEVRASGFKTESLHNVLVQVTETSRLDVGMQVAAASGERVEVSGEATLDRKSVV